ncbi:hypothetical protein EV182_006994, partial [Spiromyces aspiralis]
PCEQQLTLQDRQSGHQLQQLQQQQQQQQDADAVKFIACLDPTGTQSRSRPQTPAHHYHSHYCHSNYAAPKAFEHRFYINSRNKTQAPNLVILDRVFQGRRIHGKYEMFVEDDDGNPVYGFLTCGHSLVEAPVSRHVTPRTSAMFDVPKKPNHDQHADHVAGTDQGVLSEQPEEPQSRNSNTNSPYAGSRADLPMIHSEVYLPKVGHATSVVSAPHTPLLNTASLSVHCHNEYVSHKGRVAAASANQRATIHSQLKGVFAEDSRRWSRVEAIWDNFTAQVTKLDHAEAAQPPINIHQRCL